MSTENNGGTDGSQRTQLVDFATAELARAEPARLREVVRELLRDKGLWAVIAEHFQDEGSAGSLQFDKAVAAHKVRTWDATHGNLLAAFPGVNEAKLSQMIGRELRRVYEVNHGRIVRQLLAPPTKAAP